MELFLGMRHVRHPRSVRESGAAACHNVGLRNLGSTRFILAGVSEIPQANSSPWNLSACLTGQAPAGKAVVLPLLGSGACVRRHICRDASSNWEQGRQGESKKGTRLFSGAGSEVWFEYMDPYGCISPWFEF